MSKHPSTRFDQLRAMREAQFAANEARKKQAEKMGAVAHDTAPAKAEALSEPTPVAEAEKPKTATAKKPAKKSAPKKAAEKAPKPAKAKKKAGR